MGNYNLEKVLQCCLLGKRSPDYKLLRGIEDEDIKYIRSLFSRPRLERAKESLDKPKDFDKRYNLNDKLEEFWERTSKKDKYILNRLIRAIRINYKLEDGPNSEALYRESEEDRWINKSSIIEVWILGQSNILDKLMDYNPYAQDIAIGIIKLYYKGLLTEDIIHLNLEGVPYITYVELMLIGKRNNLAANELLPLYRGKFNIEDLVILSKLGIPFSGKKLGEMLIPLPKPNLLLETEWSIGVISTIPIIPFDKLKDLWSSSNLVEQFAWESYYNRKISLIHPFRDTCYKRGLIKVRDPLNPLGDNITLFELKTGRRGYRGIPEYKDIVKLLEELRRKYKE